MAGICGWLGAPVTPQEAHALADKMGRVLCRFDGARVESVRVTNAGMAAGSQQARHAVHIIDNLLISLYGELGTGSASQSGGTNTAEEKCKDIAKAYRRQGTDFVSTLSGAFACALIDPLAQEAVVCTDRMGIYPIVFQHSGSTLIFGSSSATLRPHPAATTAIDPQAIYDYLYFHAIPAPRTIYRGHSRLLPGEFVRFSRGVISVSRYWEMRFEEHVRRPFEELRQDFLNALRESVRSAAHGRRVGAFLSGGTDSSTVAGILGEISGQPARTYSIGFGAEGYDEMEYARIAARRFSTDHHEYYVTPNDIVETIPKLAMVHDQPFGNSSAVPTYCCARMAREDGIDLLLAGDGGDELFGGNERYATQHIFSYYEHLPSALRSALEPLLLRLPGADTLSLLRRARGYVRQARIPMPARLETYNLLERIGATQVLSMDFLASVDTGLPIAHLTSVYRRVAADSLINRMLGLDLKFTLADSDLPKVNRSCELAGVAVAYPLMDERLVTFSASLAPSLKLRGTRLRYFFKEALRGFLPNEIITKHKHGFGLPFGPWFQSHQPLREIVMDSLQRLKFRGIVRPEFIDDLTGNLIVQHSGYYGTMVWVLMMLEQWYTQQATTPSLQTVRS